MRGMLYGRIGFLAVLALTLGRPTLFYRVLRGSCESD